MNKIRKSQTGRPHTLTQNEKARVKKFSDDWQTEGMPDI